MLSALRAAARQVWMPTVHFPPTRQFHFSHRPIPTNSSLKLRNQIAIPSISNQFQTRILRIGTAIFPKVPLQHFGNWPMLLPEQPLPEDVYVPSQKLSPSTTIPAPPQTTTLAPVEQPPVPQIWNPDEIPVNPS